MEKNDLELVLDVKENNNNDSLKELINRHSNIFYNVVHKFSPHILASGQNLQDIYDEKDLTIYESVKDFKFDKKCKISTHIANMTRYKCLDLLNPRQNRNISVTDEELKFLLESKVYESPKNTNLLDYILNTLDNLKDKRIKKIFELKYIYDINSWKEIGDQMNISYETARLLNKKGLKYLKKKISEENKNNFEIDN